MVLRWCLNCCCAAHSISARGWPNPANSRSAPFSPAASTSPRLKPFAISSKRQHSTRRGPLSRRVAPVKQPLVELIALPEAGIDFAEDDVDVAPAAEIARRIGEL